MAPAARQRVRAHEGHLSIDSSSLAISSDSVVPGRLRRPSRRPLSPPPSPPATVPRPFCGTRAAPRERRNTECHQFHIVLAVDTEGPQRAVAPPRGRAKGGSERVRDATLDESLTFVRPVPQNPPSFGSVRRSMLGPRWPNSRQIRRASKGPQCPLPSYPP